MNVPHSIRETRQRNQFGFTLVEAVISIVIVGVMVAAAYSTLGATAYARQVSEFQSKRSQLAEFLLSEIIQRTFEDREGIPALGREADETAVNRSDYDDIDDYHNFTESPPRYRNGVIMPNVAGWTWSAKVVNVQPSNVEVDNAGETDLRRITVTVTSPDSKETKLRALRTRYGVFERAVSIDTDIVSTCVGEIQIGNDTSQKFANGTALLSSAPNP